MLKYQFNDSTIKEKTLLLREEGSNIATRATEHYYVRLYTWKGKYVEVWSSSHIPWQDIVKIKVLDRFNLLKPYLPGVFFARHRRSTE